MLDFKPNLLMGRTEQSDGQFCLSAGLYSNILILLWGPAENGRI